MSIQCSSNICGLDGEKCGNCIAEKEYIIQIERAVKLLVDAQWFLQKRTFGQDCNNLACEIQTLIQEIEG
jgi:hypothetical protein